MTVSLLPGTPLSPVVAQPQFVANAPRAVAVIQGVPYQINSYTIGANAHGASDTASVTLPISSNPDFTIELFRDASDTSPVYIEIYAGFPQSVAVSLTDISQLSRRFLGIVDQYSAKFGVDQITFQCRSLAAPLIDTTLTTYSQNQTTQDFVAAQAASIGLTTKFTIPTPPVTLQQVLGYDNIGGAGLSAAVYRMKIWDLILRCAQVDDVDVWVDSQAVLHYEAPWLVQRNTVNLDWFRDFEKEGLEATHSPQFSKNIQVEVYTYQKRVRTSTSVRIVTDALGGVTVQQSTRQVTSSIIPGTAESLSTSTSPTGAVSTTISSSTGGAFHAAGQQAAAESGKERYTFYLKNVSPAFANQYAQAMWRQISMHEYAIQGKLPMTQALLSELSITSLIRLANTPYDKVNDIYWPRELNESFDLTGGWAIDTHAVNHTPPNGAI